MPGPLRPIASVYGSSLLPFLPPHGGGPGLGLGMAAVAPEKQYEHHRLRLRGLQEIRGVLGVREAEVPHGTGPHDQHHCPHHLVRQVGAEPEEDHPRVHKLNIRGELGAPLRGRVVAHRTALHGPNRGQHFKIGSTRRGEERPVLFPREIPDPLIHTDCDKERHHSQNEAVADQP